MGKRTNRTTQKLFYAFLALGIVSCILLALKRIFWGLEVDEQYTVIMAYRLAKGDIPLLEMWEAHQTSSLLYFLPTYLFIKIKGSSAYLVIFLRVIGTFIGLSISCFWYFTFRKKIPKSVCLFIALVIFIVLPKFIQSPEFTNQQIWFLFLTILLVYLGWTKEKLIYYFLAGLSLLLEVMAYPSCILLFLFLFFAVGERKKKIIFGATFLFGGVLLAFLLFIRCGFQNVLPCVKGILSDGSHSKGIFEKITGYCTEVPILLVYVVIYAIIAAAITFIFTLILKKINYKANQYRVFCVVWVLISFVDQLRFWIIEKSSIIHPQYCYLVLYLAGIGFWLTSGSNVKNKWRRLFVVSYVCSGIVLISILLLTVLDLKSTLVHLLPGCLVGILVLGDSITEKDNNRTVMDFIPAYMMFATILCVTFFGQIWLVRVDNIDYREDLRFNSQKALFGAAKGVICEYQDGYANNINMAFMQENVSFGSKVLVVGGRNLIYTLGEYEVCAPSTISTPTYNQNTVDYYTINPEKIPDYIVVEEKYYKENYNLDENFLNWLNDNYTDSNLDNGYIHIYRSK